MLAAAPKGAWLMWADFDTVFAGRAFVPPLAQYAEERAHVVLSGQISEVLAGNGYSGSLASPQLKYYDIDTCIGTPPSARAANISSGNGWHAQNQAIYIAPRKINRFHSQAAGAQLKLGRSMCHVLIACEHACVRARMRACLCVGNSRIGGVGGWRRHCSVQMTNVLDGLGLCL